MIRPLSQSGLHRIPHSLRQRVARAGGAKASGQVLDDFNERQEERVLHPTKGFRKLSVKRGRAQAIVASIHQGQNADLRSMRRFLQQGY